VIRKPNKTNLQWRGGVSAQQSGSRREA
jgi:hypothetical protein